MNWKASLEKETSSNFVQHGMAKTVKNNQHVYYYCNRSRSNRKLPVESEHRNRAAKSQG